MPSQDTQKQSKEDTLFEVVYQLAKEKNEAQLTEMVKKGYCINAFQGEYNPVMLLAKERDSESVEFLINKFKASRNHAVQGSAIGGHVEKGNILRLMAFTGNEELRKSLAEEAKKKSDSLDVSALQIKAARLNKIMKEHQLNFQESQSLTVTGARAWLLQGPQLIRDKKINSDIFWEITSRVLGGLSLHETEHVFASEHNHLFRGMKGDFTTGFFSFFRPQQETEKLVHEVEQKYQKRIKFSDEI